MLEIAGTDNPRFGAIVGRGVVGRSKSCVGDTDGDPKKNVGLGLGRDAVGAGENTDISIAP
jgi:hypothetical protein